MTNTMLSTRRMRSLPLMAMGTILILMMLFAGVQIASADGSGNTDTMNAVCMQDVYSTFGQGGGLNCTANDVSLASATNITILDDGCAFPGDTVTFRADFQVQVTAGQRHDVGIYFSRDGDPNGDGALTGACTISTPAYAPDLPWLDLDGTTDNTTNSNSFGYCSTNGGSTLASPTTPCSSNASCTTVFGSTATCNEFGSGITGSQPYQDTCGDIEKPGHNPLFPTITQTVVCTDDNANGQLDLPYCTSWRQSGANELCLTPLAAYPGAPSKCNCDPGFGIAIQVPGKIVVDKVTIPSPDLTNTSFNFTLAGGPNAVSTPFGLANAATPFDSGGLATGATPYSVTEGALPTGWALTTATCTSNQTGNTPTPNNIVLHSGETVTCTFTNTNNNALGVTLGDFSATCNSATPVITWETLSEANTAGFNLWRSESAVAPQVQLNASMIAAHPGSTQGYSYNWTDSTAQPGQSYYYWLEDVDINGATRLNGPIEALCVGPTAVTVSDLEANGSAAPATVWWAPLIALIVGIGLAILLSRRAKTA